MGVQTQLTLKEAQVLFNAFHIDSLTPTQDGVVDTTYLTKHYVLKHYERKIDSKIAKDKALLETLAKASLNTPKHLAHNGSWHLYTRLRGTSPKHTTLMHIQALARFLAKLHTKTQHLKNHEQFLEQYPIQERLSFVKQKFYLYYKKLQTLQELSLENDGFIHGDIFCDNTLFDGNKIAVFDFIDGGAGSFAFECGVALLAFNPHKKKSFTKLFLDTYNQKAPKKLTYSEVQQQIQNGAKLYALLRICKYGSTKRAKELSKHLIK